MEERMLQAGREVSLFSILGCVCFWVDSICAPPKCRPDGMMAEFWIQRQFWNGYWTDGGEFVDREPSRWPFQAGSKRSLCTRQRRCFFDFHATKASLRKWRLRRDMGCKCDGAADVKQKRAFRKSSA